MQLSELFSISPSLCFIQSSPCSPCSPRDSTSVSRPFSSRSETQVGQTNQDHSEKVLLNLEEVTVSDRGAPSWRTVVDARSVSLTLSNTLSLPRFCAGAWRLACSGVAETLRGRSPTRSQSRSRLRETRAQRAWMNSGCLCPPPSLPRILGPVPHKAISTQQNSSSWILDPHRKVGSASPPPHTHTHPLSRGTSLGPDLPSLSSHLPSF